MTTRRCWGECLENCRWPDLRLRLQSGEFHGFHEIHWVIQCCDVRYVTTVLNTGFVSAPLVTQTFQRFRRDVLEGTLEEMLDMEDVMAKSNSTVGDISKRQAEFPGNPEEDTNKSDVCESRTEVSTPFWASNSNGKVQPIRTIYLPIRTHDCLRLEQSWTTKSLSRLSIRKSARKHWLCNPTLGSLGDSVEIDNDLCFVTAEHWPSAVPGTAPVNRNTSGTDSWLTIPTTTVLASSWTGSSSPHAVCAGEILYSSI